MRILLGLGALVATALVVFLLLPSPIDSRPFPTDPPPPFAGPLASNDALHACERISVGEIPHSDKLLIDEGGRIYAGDDLGRVHRLTPDGDGGYTREVLATIEGHPMELAFAPDGRLVVADLEGSHVAVDRSGGVTRLPTLDDLPRAMPGVAVGSDGTIYYGADAASHGGHGPDGVFLDMLEARNSGELRAWDPSTGTVRTLVTGLYTPVGIELSAKEDFVAVGEFWAYRVTRYWLTGPRAGTSDRLLDNLPGVVDGVASDRRGTFYVTLPAYRNAFLDWLHERPRLKNQMAKLVRPLLGLGAQPAPAGTAVLAVDETGRVLRSYHDPDGRRVDQVTTAEVHDGHLYLGSIAHDWIARCPL